MRFRRWAFAAGLSIASALPAQTPTPSPDGFGEIVLYRRQSMAGLANGCPIRYKGVEIVELGRGKYATWRVPPGRYILTNRTGSVEVSVAAGETRYVRCEMKMGPFTYRADLQIVDKESFDEHGSDFKEKPIEVHSSGGM